MAFPPKKGTRNIVGQGAIVRSLRKPKKSAMPACDCAPGESCPSCAGKKSPSALPC
jgi:hypothetical protein